MFTILVLFEKEVQKFKADSMEKVREFLDFFKELLPPGRVQIYQLLGRHRGMNNEVVRPKRHYDRVLIS